RHSASVSSRSFWRCCPILPPSSCSCSSRMTRPRPDSTRPPISGRHSLHRPDGDDDPNMRKSGGFMRIAIILRAVAGLVLLLAMAVGAVAADKVKVGFVYVGPIGDHGWSYQHHAGLKAVESEFGDKVQTTYVENVSEGPDAERVIQQLAQQGNDIIF